LGCSGFSDTVTETIVIKVDYDTTDHNYFTNISDVFCGNYILNGQSYSSPGTYYQTLSKINGCDSTIILNLSLNNSYGIDFQTACGSYTWLDGITYTNNNNNATYNLTNVAGCDSIVTLNLTIIPNQFSPDFTVSQTLFTSPPFAVQFNNTTPNASNYNFTWDFSDGTILQSNNLSVFHEYLYNGLYDVILIAEDILTNCTDTMYKSDYIYCTGGANGINDITSNISLHPNPTQDQITIDIKGYNGPVNVEVYDLQGRLLETTRTTTVSLRKYERGIYIFKVNYGEITEEVRVVRD